MADIADWSDLETQLQEVKELLHSVEQRLQQVSQGAIAKQDLLQQQEQLKAELQDLQTSSDAHNLAKNQSSQPTHQQSKIRRKPNSKYVPNSAPLPPRIDEIHRQLLEISDRLEQIEAEIESRLLSWSSFSEPFWQVVRFTGLGIVIGIILRSCAVS